jgi:hypothetical protein
VPSGMYKNVVRHALFLRSRSILFVRHTRLSHSIEQSNVSGIDCQGGSASTGAADKR